MANNNVTHTLDFKNLTNEFVCEELDKVLTCEGQDVKFCSCILTKDMSGRPKTELVIELNGEMLLLKRIHKLELNLENTFYIDKCVSDENLLILLKDLIGFNAYKICTTLVRQL